MKKPTKSTLHTVCLIDYILSNSKGKVRNYGIICSGISDHDIIHCTRKTKTVKTGKYKNISIRSYRNSSKPSLLERLELVIAWFRVQLTINLTSGD